MKEPTLRRSHRRVGVFLGALIFLQTLSGFFLGFEWLLGLHNGVGDFINAQNLDTGLGVWDFIFVNIHYGGGTLGALYHILLGAALMWLLASGVLIDRLVRRRLGGRKAKG